MIAILAFLKLVPLRTWGILGLIAAIILGISILLAHEREIGRNEIRPQVAAIQAQFDAAQQANSANDAAIKTLQQSLAECEKNRLAEVAQTAEVKATYAKAVEAFKQTDAKMHAATTQRIATTCKDIAHQPTCVTAAP